MKMIPLAALALTFAVASFGTTAHAQAQGELTYEQFIDSCKNPATHGHQRPPQNIRVACKNVARSWQPIEAGSTSLSEARNLSAELFSDKYHVALANFVIAVPELSVSCPRLREVTETSEIEKSLTCEQVIAETRDLEAICFDAINEAIAENPDLVVIVPTGRTYNACEGTGQKP